MMGVVKFIFPNNLGIYLHDTPHRWGFDQTDRRISSGCVRVERAPDLYQWLFGQRLNTAAFAGPEVRVPLDRVVPVHLYRFSHEGSEALSGLA
jgi:murein L,D-transpeptidase YcbB/YkuD